MNGTSIEKNPLKILFKPKKTCALFKAIQTVIYDDKETNDETEINIVR